MTKLSPELWALLLSTAVGLPLALFHAGMQWERVKNAKQGLTLEVRTLRDNNNQRFDRIELRLTSIEGQLSAINDRHAESERWRGQMEQSVQVHEDALLRMERELGRVGT